MLVTWEAVYDIAEIADYIEAQFGIARADRFQEEIKDVWISLKHWAVFLERYTYVIADILFTSTYFRHLLFFA